MIENLNIIVECNIIQEIHQAEHTENLAPTIESNPAEIDTANEDENDQITLYLSNMNADVTKNDIKRWFGLENMQGRMLIQLRNKRYGADGKLTIKRKVAKELLKLNGFEFEGKQIVIEEFRDENENISRDRGNVTRTKKET